MKKYRMLRKLNCEAKWNFFSVAILILSTTIVQGFEVDLAVFGFRSKTVMASMPFFQPPLEVAVEDANAQYNGTIKFNARFIADAESMQCSDYADEVSRKVAHWHYRDRRPDSEALSVVISAGTHSQLCKFVQSVQSVVF